MYLSNLDNKLGVTLAVYIFLSIAGLAVDRNESIETGDRPAAMTSQSCPPIYNPEDFTIIQLLQFLDLEVTPKNIEAANAALCAGAPFENIKARDIMFFVIHDD